MWNVQINLSCLFSGSILLLKSHLNFMHSNIYYFVPFNLIIFSLVVELPENKTFIRILFI